MSEKKYKYTLERIVKEQLEKLKTSTFDVFDKDIETAEKEILKEFYRYVEQRDRAQKEAIKKVK